MRPKAFLFSTDKNFEKTFTNLNSEKLDVVSDSSLLSTCDYCFLFLGEGKKSLNNVAKYYNQNAKTVVVIPSTLLGRIKQLSIYSNAKILIYDQLLEDTQMLKKALNGKLSVPVDDYPLNAISYSELTSAMLEAAFTYFATTQLSFYISNGLTTHNLAAQIKSIKPDLELNYSNKNTKNLSLNNITVVDYDSDYLKNYFLTNYKAPKSLPKVSVEFTKPSLKLNRGVLLQFAATASIVPLLVFLITAGSLYFGFNNIDKNTQLSEAGFWVAEKFSLNKSFRESAKLGQRVLAVTDSQEIDPTEYNEDELKDYLAQLEVDLNALYKDMSFSKDSYLFSDLIDNSREVVLAAHDLVKISPLLLGINKEISYAIAFIDDSNISDVLVFSANDGKISYHEYHTANEIDQKIAGEIQAPFDSDEQWSFKYANWNPNFVASSDQIRWFLDKSLNFHAENVILVGAEYRGVLKQLEDENALLNKGFLSELLNLYLSKSFLADSQNVQLQGYLTEANLSSVYSTSDLFFHQSEFSVDGTKDIKRSVNADITLYKDKIVTEYRLEFQNNTTSDYEFWNRVSTNFVNIFEEVEGASVNVFKIADTKVAENKVILPAGKDLQIIYQISRKMGDYSNFNLSFGKSIFTNEMPLRVSVVDSESAPIYAEPQMSLTSHGKLRYTTELQRVKSFNINYK